jgi:hypothetical protein
VVAASGAEAGASVMTTGWFMTRPVYRDAAVASIGAVKRPQAPGRRGRG